MQKAALMRETCKSFSDLLTRRLVGYAPDDIRTKVKAACYVAENIDVTGGAWAPVTRRLPDSHWHEAFKAATAAMTGFWGHDMPKDILDGMAAVNSALEGFEAERASRTRDYVPHLMKFKKPAALVSYQDDVLNLASQRLIEGLTVLRDDGMLSDVKLNGFRTYIAEDWNAFVAGAAPLPSLGRMAKAMLRGIVSDLIYDAGGICADNVQAVAEQLNAQVDDLLPSSTAPSLGDGLEGQDMRGGEGIVHVLRNGAFEAYSIDPESYTLRLIEGRDVPDLAHFHVKSDEPIYIIDGRMSAEVISKALYDSQIELMREFGGADKDRIGQTAKTWQETGLAFLDCGQVFTRPVIREDGTAFLIAVGDTVTPEESADWEAGELEENGMSVKADGFAYPDCVGFEWHRIGPESAWLKLLKDQAGLDAEKGRKLLQQTVSGNWPKGIMLEGSEAGRHVYLAYGTAVAEFRAAATQAGVQVPHQESELGAIINSDPIDFSKAKIFEIEESKLEPVREPEL